MAFDIDSIRFAIRAEDLLKIRSEEDIYKHYCKDFPKGTFPSPFRTERKGASFGFYEKNNHWYWKDQGGAGEGGNVFDFVKKFDHTITTFPQILQKIITDMGLETGMPIPTQATVTKTLGRSTIGKENRSLLQMISRKWTESDYNLWKSRWGIDNFVLRMYNVGCGQQLWAQKPKEEKKLVWISVPDNPVYFYWFPISKHIKGYRPLEKDKKRKWLANTDNLTDIQGYHQCDIKRKRPRLLILTKAMKEVMFFRSFGINAMAINGENAYYHPDFIRHLRKYCILIISLYDNDRAGCHGAWVLRKEYDIPAFFVPVQWGAKNITDLWEVKEYNKCYQLINYITTWSNCHKAYGSYQNIIRHGKELEPPHSEVPMRLLNSYQETNQQHLRK